MCFLFIVCIVHNCNIIIVIVIVCKMHVSLEYSVKKIILFLINPFFRFDVFIYFCTLLYIAIPH